jgi:hypothetical protein
VSRVLSGNLGVHRCGFGKAGCSETSVSPRHEFPTALRICFVRNKVEVISNLLRALFDVLPLAFTQVGS